MADLYFSRTTSVFVLHGNTYDLTPLADVDAPGLMPYESLVVGGWDLDDSDLAKAASVHGVLDHRQIEVAGPGLSQVRPWPAAGDEEFCRNVVGGNLQCKSNDPRPVGGNNRVEGNKEDQCRNL